MHHRVADRHFQRLGEAKEALIVRLVPGDKVLRDAVGAHDAPFVMVSEEGPVRVAAAQPDLSQVVKAAVLIDLARGDVAVIVDERHLRRVVMVEVCGGGGLQEEIPIHKRFHGLDPSFPPYTGTLITIFFTAMGAPAATRGL